MKDRKDNNLIPFRRRTKSVRNLPAEPLVTEQALRSFDPEPVGEPDMEMLATFFTANPRRPATDQEIANHRDAALDALNLGQRQEPHRALVSHHARGGHHRGRYQRVVQKGLSAARNVRGWLQVHTPLGPFALTALATTAFLVAAPLIVFDHLLLAAVLVLTASGFEAVNAIPALVTPDARNEVYVDFLADRVTDLLIFGAIAIYVWDESRIAAWLSIGVIVTALLSSYARAQADALRLRSVSHFGRAERLVVAVLSLSGAALLHLTAPRPAWWIGSLLVALALTTTTLVERVVTALRQQPSLCVDLDISVSATAWDESMLPRIVDNLVRTSGAPITVIENRTELRDPLNETFLQRQVLDERGNQEDDARVIYIERHPDGTARVHFDQRGA